MAALLKEIYNEPFFAEFTIAIKKVVPEFNKKTFLANVRNPQWDQMELKQRMHHIAFSLNGVLQGNYKQKLRQVLIIMKALPQKVGGQYGSLAYMLIPDFVEQYGLMYPDLSLKAMEQITLFTSCEFAIRPFLLKYPEKVMSLMLKWSTHKDERLRRFSSEGCRPRLPWAMAIPSLKKEPSPILPVLKNLCNDPSAFVRKSVANNLNDISKDHPNLVINIATEWKNKSDASNWIIKHGCRSLLKKGNPDVLELFDTAVGTKCSLKKFQLSKSKLCIGETLPFSFELTLNEKKPSKLRVEYFVHFKKLNGLQRKKIFKITETVFYPGIPVAFNRKHSFKDLSTRKHYAGEHMLSIVINGKEHGVVQVQLL